MTGPAGEGCPVFRLRGVRYRYRNRHLALAGVDLDVLAGQHVALLGANGSGKSTLLKLLDGLVTPLDGEVTAFGEPFPPSSEGEATFRFRRRVGMLFQDPDVQLFSGTVLDDVAFGPLQLGLSEQEVRAACAEAMGLMAIEHLSDRAPFELSLGEKKRAAIASVLSLQPDVLLLDEPTASLDPRTRWALADLVADLGRRGRTVVTATHDLDLVPAIATRAVVLSEEGRVLADGPPANILRDRGLLLRANLVHDGEPIQ